MRRLSAGAQTAAERRKRENEAKRLHDLIPDLQTLKLYIEERHEGVAEPDVTHTRIIVVSRAPAIFEMGCSNRKCDGNHDLTKKVLRALKAQKESFEGSDKCTGEHKDGACDLVLSFRAEAQYGEALQESDAA